MPKFFVKQEQIQENRIIIKGQDVNHIKKVLRAEREEELQICNSETGENFLCEIKDISDKEVYCIIEQRIEQKVESNIKVTIFQGLPKADKMEYVIQKSVELGVYDITPIEMNRCIVKLDDKDKVKKVDRWQKISDICDLIKNYDIVLVAYENEKQNSIKEQLKNIKDSINKSKQIKIGVVIGPEGGMDEKDIQLLEESGAKVITLGKRILRTETVALNVLSIIMYELEN